MNPTAAHLDLSAQEIDRYSRHILIPGIGIPGQKKLKAAKVLLVGAGGLGSPAALYLAAAGVGKIGIIDGDKVDATNLQRQVLYSTELIGQSKVAAARRRLLDLNPYIEVEAFDLRLTADNALDIIKGFDLIVDGTDNFASRFLVNDACGLLRKPNVYGSVHRFQGQVSVFWRGKGPCYRCLYPEPPPAGSVPSCAESGVFGVLPGVIGTLQAAEALKIILGIGNPLVGEILLYDALSLQIKKIPLQKNVDCPLCGKNPRISKLAQETLSCAYSPELITADQLELKMDHAEKFILLDVREKFEHDAQHLPGARLLPLAELPQRFTELNQDEEIIVYCKSGGRSEKAALFLHSQGLRKVASLSGGIQAWNKRGLHV